MSNADRFRALAQAKFHKIPVYGHNVSARCQRAVLSVLAGFDGQTISMRAIGDRAGMSPGHVQLCIEALRLNDLIGSKVKKAEGSNSYTIRWDQLEKMSADSELYIRPGQTAKSDTYKARYMRGWRRARKVAAKSLREVAAMGGGA